MQTFGIFQKERLGNEKGPPEFQTEELRTGIKKEAATMERPPLLFSLQAHRAGQTVQLAEISLHAFQEAARFGLGKKVALVSFQPLEQRGAVRFEDEPFLPGPDGFRRFSRGGQDVAVMFPHALASASSASAIRPILK
jgi:hypothetical protein